MNDNTLATAAPTTTSSYILSKEDFDQYTTDWKEFAGQSGETSLKDAFLTPGHTRLTALNFPLDRLQWLVSAVGVRQIRARFLLMPGSARNQFNLALYATDDTGYQLSAYYLPDLYYTPSASEALETKEDNMYMPIPQSLAATWAEYWFGASDITADMFTTYTTEHEPTTLEGYNFDVKDFVSILFGSGQNISLGLGLHKYHSSTATSETEFTHTFGLVLQAPADAQAARVAGAVGGAARMDFDMAFPCPPGT
ncbi:MAG: hypothetical protein JWP58_481 [Hymenobacter sp.]|nr:hypothetical protein [Hymenobacter sp.]